MSQDLMPIEPITIRTTPSVEIEKTEITKRAVANSVTEHVQRHFPGLSGLARRRANVEFHALDGAARFLTDIFNHLSGDEMIMQDKSIVSPQKVLGLFMGLLAYNWQVSGQGKFFVGERG